MSSRFANMGDRLKRPSADDCVPNKENPPKPDNPDEDGDDDENEAGSGRKDKEKDMTEAELNQVKADARADGVKAERDRFTAVLASEHYQGREAVAHKMLGKDMSADDIIDVLATAPAAASAPEANDEGNPDPEEAARAEMRDAIKATGNSGIDPNAGGGKPSQGADNSALWDKVIAKVCPDQTK